GYRFALRRLEHPASIQAGGPLNIKMWWQNLGVAPAYREYDLSLELRSPTIHTAMTLKSDLRKWLPGDAVWEGSVPVDSALPAGRYRIRVAILDPRTHQPAIQLATAGRESDRWYAISELDVTPAAATSK